MNGVLCLDKPQEMTSFVACACVRPALGIKKAGHSGTLDPMATGVLPVLCGHATRVLAFLPSHDKRYMVEVAFGKQSDTLDIWGAVEDTGRPPPSLSALEDALPAFRGEILQVPPMVSALKKDGVRLYELARRGVEVEREARPVTIHRLDLLSFDGEKATFDCACSKGTYMRTIADDLGRLLGCGALMSGLRRTEAVGFSLNDCLTLDELRAKTPDELAARLLPVDRLLETYPSVAVTAPQATRFKNGGALSLERLREPVTGLTRVYDPEGHFLGLGRPEGEELAIAKLFL